MISTVRLFDCDQMCEVDGSTQTQAFIFERFRGNWEASGDILAHINSLCCRAWGEKNSWTRPVGEQDEHAHGNGMVGSWLPETVK